jgi:hypothetical protein
MSGSISSVGFADQYAATVERKALSAIQQQGQQSLRLIQAATPPANTAAGVGQHLNVKA